MEDPYAESMETIVYTAMHEGHTRSYAEMTTKALIAAFAEYPDALHARDPIYRSVYENRGGEPAPMTLIKVCLEVPFPTKGEADNG